MKPRLNQAGQAVTEYILLLIIAVAIAVLVGERVFTPIKKWTDYYLGTYTSCLLDYGVLPGSSGGTVTECQQQAISAGMAGSGSKGGNGEGDSNSSDTANEAHKSGSLGEAQRANSAASRRRGGGSSNQVVNQKGNAVNFGKNAGTSDTNNGDPSSTALNTSEDYLEARRRRNRKFNQNNERHSKTRGLTGIRSEDIEKLSRSGEPQLVVLNSDFPGPAPKRIPFKKPSTKSTLSDSDANESFGIGNFFRLAIMLMIIIGIIYVVGGQLNSVSKSRED